MANPATDTATYSGERVTIKIRLGIPAKSSRDPHRPSDGEQCLLLFVRRLQQERLISSSEHGALSDDAKRFSFTLRQYPVKQRLDKVCTAYRVTTGRNLSFEAQPSSEDIADVASEGVDWSGMFGRALGALRHLNPFDD